MDEILKSTSEFNKREYLNCLELWNYEPNVDYVVLADPDGNTFCVVQV